MGVFECAFGVPVFRCAFGVCSVLGCFVVLLNLGAFRVTFIFQFASFGIVMGFLQEPNTVCSGLY